MKKILVLVMLMASWGFGAAATMYVTPAGAGDKSGSAWANAMGLAEWQTDVQSNAEEGDIYYVKGGTYTLTGNWSTARTATFNLSTIQVIGVKATTTAEPPTVTDYAYNDDRPLIAASTYTFDWVSPAKGWVFKNLRVTTAASYGFRVYQYTRIENCKSTNTAATASYNAFYASSVSNFIDCEGICTNGAAFQVNIGSHINGCYAHDSKWGYWIGTQYPIFTNNIADTCSQYGIHLPVDVASVSFGHALFANNTIYNCGTGFNGNGGYYMQVYNNIISGCTVGVAWGDVTASRASVYFDYNCLNNTTDVTGNITVGSHVLLATNPLLEDPANGDFSLLPASLCNNNGKPTLSSGYSSIGAYGARYSPAVGRLKR